MVVENSLLIYRASALKTTLGIYFVRSNVSKSLQNILDAPSIVRLTLYLEE